MKKSQLILLIAFLICFQPVVTGQTNRDFKKFAKFINKNRPDKVTKLINRGKDVNARDYLDRTPLLYSLQKDRLSISKMLISAGANIKLNDQAKNGCLHYAIQHSSNDDIVNELIDMGANLEMANDNLYTPFHFSLHYKCPHLSLILLDMGADYGKTTLNGRNSIHHAVTSGCREMVEKLISLGVDYDASDDHGDTPFMLALKLDWRDISTMLMEMGAKADIANVSGYTPIYFAVKNEDDKMFDQLISQGVPVDVPADGITPVVAAAKQGNTYFTKELLRNGAVNPMNCDVHDDCYITAFIYSAGAELAEKDEKITLYQNSLNIYNLALEKYKAELNTIRAKNTAKFCGEVCLIAAASAASPGYYTPTPTSGANYETDRRIYLKSRIELCEERIQELEKIVNP